LGSDRYVPCRERPRTRRCSLPPRQRLPPRSRRANIRQTVMIISPCDIMARRACNLTRRTDAARRECPLWYLWRDRAVRAGGRRTLESQSHPWRERRSLDARQSAATMYRTCLVACTVSRVVRTAGSARDYPTAAPTEGRQTYLEGAGTFDNLTTFQRRNAPSP
jgi:hypothetical protein